MFKKIFAIFARYSPEEVRESELAQERARQAQKAAQQRELERRTQAQRPEEEIDVPVDLPEAPEPQTATPEEKPKDDLPMAA